MTPQRRALIVAALGFMRLRWRDPEPPAAAALTRWLDSWRGIGAVTVGMARQGFDLRLTRYDERGWRATFFASGHGALDHRLDRVGVGTDTVAGGAERGLGGTDQGGE